MALDVAFDRASLSVSAIEIPNTMSSPADCGARGLKRLGLVYFYCWRDFPGSFDGYSDLGWTNVAGGGSVLRRSGVAQRMPVCNGESFSEKHLP